MEEDWQPHPLRGGIYVEGGTSEWIKALVVGAELDATQSQLVDAALDLLDGVALVGVNRHEADQLVRMRACKKGGLVVDIADPLHTRAFPSGRHGAAFEPDPEHAGAIDRLHRRQKVGPANSS